MQNIVGRGANSNPINRFERINYEIDPDDDVAPDVPKTEFYRDASKSIISFNDSPDVGFGASVNPYRGCEHGCSYCYARPTHEYFGLSSGLDFESKIFIKDDAPYYLRSELLRPTWKPQVLAMSGVTDPYQPIERKTQLTRRCLQVLLDFRQPTVIITKSRLVVRDIDILKEMAQYQGIVVNISLTTLDEKIAHQLEPRSPGPLQRLEAISQLTKAGIPVCVLVAPIIPAINDHEIPAILKECSQAGAQCANYVLLRLPYAVKEIFTQWLDRYFPDRKDKVLNRLKTMREGKLYNSGFGKRMVGEGVWADQISTLFSISSRRAGIDKIYPELSLASFRRPEQDQLTLF